MTDDQFQPPVEARRILLCGGDKNSVPLVKMFGELFHQRHADLERETLFTTDPAQALMRLSLKPSVVIMSHRIGNTDAVMAYVAKLKEKNADLAIAVFSASQVDPAIEASPFVEGVLQLGNPFGILELLAWPDLVQLHEEFAERKKGRGSTRIDADNPASFR